MMIGGKRGHAHCGPNPPGSRLRGAALIAALSAVCSACAFSPFPTASAASSPAQTSTLVSTTSQVSQAGNGETVLIRQTEELQLRASFIVKFRNEPETLAIARSWRRDPDSATAHYHRWASDHAELRHLLLKSASYSGELVLALPASAPDHMDPDHVLASLRSMDNVAYADLDSIAHPSFGGTQ